MVSVDFKKIEEKRNGLFQSYKKKKELGFILLGSGLALVIIFLVIIVKYLNSGKDSGPFFTASLIVGALLMVAALVFLILAYLERRDYQNKFCHHIEREVIGILYAEPVFEEENKIDINEIMSFELVDKPDRYQSGNYFLTKYKEVEIEMAKITLEKEEIEKKKIIYKSYFSGFFIHLKMKMPHKGTLLVKEAEFWDKDSDTEFEKFEVSSSEVNEKLKIYTSSEALAERVLKDSVIEFLMNISANGGSQTSLVVKDDDLYLIFNNQMNCFKPKIKTPLNKASLKPVIEQFSLPMELIDAIISK